MAQNKTTPTKATAKPAKAAPALQKSTGQKPPVPKSDQRSGQRTGQQSGKAVAKATLQRPIASKAVPVKPSTKTNQPKVAATTVAKTVNGAGATIKKPLTTGKVAASSAPAKPVAKTPTPKVEMSQSAVKKTEAPKAAAVKAAVAKPMVAPTAKVLPVAVKPPVATAPKAIAPVRPMAAAAKAAAPVVGLRPAAPVAVKPGVMPPFRPAATGFMKPGMVRPAMPAGVAGAIARPPVVGAPAAPAVEAGPKKQVSSRHGFKTNEWIVYPAHGVGRITAIDEQEIAGMALELFVITFDKDKLTLRVPTGKAQQVGMRKLAEDGVVRRAMETLKGKARIKRTMWSRRAQEFEAKINSGDLVSIAEVVRDLYRAENQPEQSYSERQLYEAALDRMAREIAAVDKIDERTASQRVVEVLSKSAKGRKAAGEEAAAAAAASAGSEDADVKAA